MDFGGFRRAGFYDLEDLDEGNFGTNYIRGVSANSTKHLSISNN